VDDGLGSVRGLVDPIGQVVQSYSFSPFGVPLGESGGEPYGFTGEQWDASAGLVFLRARYYQPGVGRFINKDPWPADMFQPQTFNAWPYVTNNPVNRVDPSGYFSNDQIARSLGANDFDEVTQMFREAGGKWGLLRLLQLADSNDWMSLLVVGFFGAKHEPVGQFSCANGEISLGQYKDLRDLVFHLSYQDRELDFIYWRKKVQGYYLNFGKGFRDGYDTDVPDLAMVSLDVDIWAPEGWAGVGVGGKVVYIIDRYGRAYVSLGLAGGAGISPVVGGYSEGYVNYPGIRTQEGPVRRIPYRGELARLISGIDVGVDLNLAIFSFGVETNLDRTFMRKMIGTAGFAIWQLSIGGELSGTLPVPFSVNPDGWDWVDHLPGYGEEDIPRQWDSASIGCGC